jgi:hypothetical protein
VSLDRTAGRVESHAAVAAALKARAAGNKSNDVTLALVDLRPDLAGLPFRRGQACRLSPEATAHFDECATALRSLVFTPANLIGQFTTDAKRDRWLKEGSVAVLMQMLMSEAFGVREILVEQLARVKGKSATAALAQVALFDLEPRVRERAIGALAARPARDYRHTLLRAFEHPWPVIADHAAEALAALKMKDAVPDLVALLDRPDPAAPYRKPLTPLRFVKEMVRVNHLRNCLLCHPPSFASTDKIRGLVPATDQPLSQAYYQAPNKGIFVRADITYLKQDFSRMLKVARPGKWPEVQRFDFFVRERIASERDRQASSARMNAGLHPQQHSLMFALRELTGHDPGSTVGDWKEYVFSRDAEEWAAPVRR